MLYRNRRIYGSTKIHQAGIIDSPQRCFRSAVASGIGAGFNALQMQAEVAKSEVTHLDDEPSLIGHVGLLERNVTPKSCFDGETHATFNASEYECFEFAVHYLSNLVRDSDVRAAIQFRGAVVGVEVFDIEGGEGIERRLAAPGGTGNYDHSRSHQPPKSRSLPSCISAGRSVRIRRPWLSMMPCSWSLRTAAFPRSTAAAWCGSFVGFGFLAFGMGIVFTPLFKLGWPLCALSVSCYRRRT